MSDEIIWLGLLGFFSFVFVAIFANPVVGMSSTDGLEISELKQYNVLKEITRVQGPGTGGTGDTARCDEGDKILSGGYRILTMFTDENFRISWNHASSDNGWSVGMSSTDGLETSGTFTIYALCADLPPMHIPPP